VSTGWLIHNPAAGRFPSGPFLSRAVDVLTRAGWTIRVEECGPGQDLAERAAEAVAAGCEAVFVAGGDGSVGRVAGALAGTPTALGVLPAGTANVWAQQFNLPRLGWTSPFALEEAAARLARGRVRLVDIGTCNGQPFLMWAGVGLDAQVVNSIEPRERWEKVLATIHYAVQTVWTAWNWTGIPVRVSANNQVWEDRFLVAVATNIRSYAGGLLELSPAAKVDDGLLDFWLIGGTSLSDAVLRVAQVLTGRHVDASGVAHFQAEEALFDLPADTALHLDGEPGVIQPPAHLRVQKRVLRVLVPSGTRPFLFSEPDSAAAEVG
jgi:YegS/Rv2252/BmrU family lipid kinase